MEMKLKSLRIHANYGKPGYRVQAEFEGYNNKIDLELPEKLGGDIVTMCLDNIVDAVRSVAMTTADSILRGPDTAAKEIEHARPER